MTLWRRALPLVCAAGLLAAVAALAPQGGSASEGKVHRYRIAVSGMT